jgi:hypothetical protein
MGVLLAAKVSGLKVQRGLVDHPDNLDVVRRLDELHAGDGAGGEDAGAKVGSRAESDLEWVSPERGHVQRLPSLPRRLRPSRWPSASPI